jgi:hypothetical protein
MSWQTSHTKLGMSARSKIQLLLWSYFWLLIFEGALRKWVFPGFSNPLLVIRDPIAIVTLILGLPYLLRSRWAVWVWAFWLIGIISVFTALAFGHGDILTAFFGARIFWFQLPLIFLFPAVFDYKDTIRFLKASAILAIPMTILAGLQFSLPQNHFLNLAPGGEAGVGFSGALGKFRPPGTFSFISGLAEFFSLACVGVIAIFFIGKRPLPKWIFFSLLATIAVLPISISRTLLYKYLTNIISALVALLPTNRGLKMMIPFFILLSISITGASFFKIVQEAQEAFFARWIEASDQQSTSNGFSQAFQKRLQSNTLDELRIIMDQPLLGRGIGLGSNVGAMRVSGSRDFLVSESAWGMLIGELGSLLGVVVVGLRILLGIVMLKKSIFELKNGNPLPMLLCGVSVVGVVLGNTAQPTSLGFIVVCAGLLLAACNSNFSSVHYPFSNSLQLSADHAN